MKKIFIYVMILITPVLVTGKKSISVVYEIVKESINRYDSCGNKTGLWITEKDGTYDNFTHVGTYFKGKQDGISLDIVNDKRTGNLSQIGLDIYENGKPRQVLWWSYNGKDSIGLLVAYDSVMKIDSRFSDVCKHIYYISPDSVCQAYNRIYENGSIMKEGWIIFPFGEDPVVNFFEVGLWKYYNLDGTVKIKDKSAGWLDNGVLWKEK